jgi:hypothetical protein
MKTFKRFMIWLFCSILGHEYRKMRRGKYLICLRCGEKV